jgi:putative endonuclease
MYYVYVLQSLKDKSLYIGFTDNLKIRVNQHNQGLSTYTQYRKPWKLVYYEAFTNRLDAKDREEYLKSGWGFRSIKKILKRTLLW